MTEIFYLSIQVAPQLKVRCGWPTIVKEWRKILKSLALAAFRCNDLIEAFFYVQMGARDAAAGGRLPPMTVAAANDFTGSGSLRIFFCKQTPAT